METPPTLPVSDLGVCSGFDEELSTSCGVVRDAGWMRDVGRVCCGVSGGRAHQCWEGGGSVLVEAPPHMGGTMRPAMAERHKQEVSETEAKDSSCDVTSGFVSPSLELCPFFPFYT